jgi:hypothetical protein
MTQAIKYLFNFFIKLLNKMDNIGLGKQIYKKLEILVFDHFFTKNSLFRRKMTQFWSILVFFENMDWGF